MRASILICIVVLTACQSDANGANESAAGANADAGSNVTSSGNVASVAPSDPDTADSSDDPPAAPQPDRPTPDCPVIRSAGWRAHVDAMPGPNDNPRLIVSGRVTVPTGGYRVSLRMGQVAESYPVQVTVYLDAVAPSGAATQALVTHDVRGSWPSEERVGAVTVRCGGRALAHIGNIETAH